MDLRLKMKRFYAYSIYLALLSRILPSDFSKDKFKRLPRGTLFIDIKRTPSIRLKCFIFASNWIQTIRVCKLNVITFRRRSTSKVPNRISFCQTQNLAYIIYELRLSYIKIFLLFPLRKAPFWLSPPFKVQIRVHLIPYSSCDDRG